MAASKNNKYSKAASLAIQLEQSQTNLNVN
jgi:hypothetical protein